MNEVQNWLKWQYIVFTSKVSGVAYFVAVKFSKTADIRRHNGVLMHLFPTIFFLVNKEVKMNIQKFW